MASVIPVAARAKGQEAVYVLALAAWLGILVLCLEVSYPQCSSHLVLVTPLCINAFCVGSPRRRRLVFVVTHYPFDIRVTVVCLIGGCMNLETWGHFTFIKSLMV